MKRWKITWKGKVFGLQSTLAFSEGDVKRIKRNIKKYGGKNIKVKELND